MPSMKKILRTIIVCAVAVTVTLVVFYSGNAVYNHFQTAKAREQQEKLNQLYQEGQSTPPSEAQEKMNPKLTQFYAINPDIVGWLELGSGEGANRLSVPVVQRDNTYYLKHDFYGKDSSHGAVFLDYRNQTDPNSDNLIIYGHNLNDGTLFGRLGEYREAEYTQQNRFITLATLYGGEAESYAVCSVFLAATLPEHHFPFDYHNQVEFQTLEEKEEYIREIAQRSILNTGVTVGTRDELLTLSTCLYDFSGERLVVVARKLREGETTRSFEGVAVTPAKNPVMPEIWNQLYGAK